MITQIIALALQICLRLIPDHNQIQLIKVVSEKISNDKRIKAWIEVSDSPPAN